MEVIFEWSAALFRGLFGADWLGTHFGIVKTLHVYSVMLWTSSAIGGFYYVVVAARERYSNKGDEELRRRYEWARWHFNKVVILEHVALIIMLPTGLMLATTLGWNQEIGWLAQKVAIVTFVFIPMEIIDIALSHWIVPRAMLGRSDQPAHYRRVMTFHTRFLRVTSYIILVTFPWVVYLVVAKPDWV